MLQHEATSYRRHDESVPCFPWKIPVRPERRSCHEFCNVRARLRKYKESDVQHGCISFV